MLLVLQLVPLIVGPSFFRCRSRRDYLLKLRALRLLVEISKGGSDPSLHTCSCRNSAAFLHVFFRLCDDWRLLLGDVQVLLQGLTKSESNDSLIGTPGHTLRLLPLPTQPQDRSLLRLDHALEGASDFVL